MSEQNIYDEPAFFAGYKKLRDAPNGFNSYFEQPLLYSLLPPVKDKIVCDLGCGLGECCRYAASLGAKKVIGVDISSNMLKDAKEKTHNDRITYLNESIEQFEYKGEPLSVVISSFTFHYIANIQKLFRKVNCWLEMGGFFVFSVDHPIMTANPMWEVVDLNGKPTWALINYRDERQILQNWFVEGVKKYHHKLETYVNGLINSGFSIEKLLEPMPNDELIEKNEKLAIHKLRPPLLVIKAKKSNSL